MNYDKSFIFIFHRKANTLKSFNKAYDKWRCFKGDYDLSKINRPISWAVEGDVHWLMDGKKMLVYLWHPSFPQKSVRSVNEMIKLEKMDKLVLLEHLLSIATGAPFFLLEIKSGIGNRLKAFESILKIIDDLKITDRIWFDSYSINELEELKQLDNSVLTSLHTHFLMKNRILHTPNDSNYFKKDRNILSFDKLSSVDFITTFARPSLRETKRISAHLENYNKKLILGGLFSPFWLRVAWASGALGGYLWSSSNLLDVKCLLSG